MSTFQTTNQKYQSLPNPPFDHIAATRATVSSLDISSFSPIKSCSSCCGVLCTSIAFVMFIMFQIDHSIIVLILFVVGILLLSLSCFQKNSAQLIFDDDSKRIYLRKYGWMHWNDTFKELGTFHDFDKLSIQSSDGNAYTLIIEFYSNDAVVIFDKFLIGHTLKYYKDKVMEINERMCKLKTEMLIDGYLHRLDDLSENEMYQTYELQKITLLVSAFYPIQLPDGEEGRSELFCDSVLS